jgi:hypothetical protein
VDNSSRMRTSVKLIFGYAVVRRHAKTGLWLTRSGVDMKFIYLESMGLTLVVQVNTSSYQKVPK